MTLNAAQYSIPDNVFEDWRRSERPDFVPNARQRIAMDAVAQAIAEGLFYNTDVTRRCAELLAVTDEQLAIGAERVEGGDFGYDLYHARGALDAEKRHQLSTQAAGELRLRVGDQIGTLVFNNDFKRCPRCVVTEVSDRVVKIRFTRVRSTYEVTAEPSSIRYAIERAYERGARKDSYAEFVATRNGGRPAPVMADVPGASDLPLFADAAAQRLCRRVGA